MSEKQASRALKRTLVGYNDYTIYRVYIKDQNKDIRVKDLQIFEDFETKLSTDLSDYQDKLIVKGFFLANKEKDFEKEEAIPNQKVVSSQLGQKVDNTNNTKEPFQK